MMKRIKRACAALVEFLTRLWPMSKSGDQVLREFEARRGENRPTGMRDASD